MKKLLCFLMALLIIGCASESSDESSSSESESNSTTTYMLIAPSVMKGPFKSNSSGFIQETDSSYDPAGKVYNFETRGNFGAFRLNSALTSQYVEACATGYYYVENTGLQSESQITLCSYSDIVANPSPVINLLTTLSHKRVKYLIDFDGLTIDQATRQAQTEVLAIFGIDPIAGTFDEMDVGIDNAIGGILLAISVIMQEGHTAGVLQTLIGDFAIDIESDGVLDDVVIKATLLANSQIVDMDAIKTNVESYYAANGVNITIDEYVKYIDSDGDGTINLNDDDLPNALVFAPVSNAELDTEYISNQQTISGLDSGFTAVDFTGLFYLNGVIQNQLDATGDLLYSGSEIQVENGDVIELRTNSSPQYATGKNAEIIFDGVYFSFATVTKEDVRPEITIYNSGSGLVDGDFLSGNSNYAIVLCAAEKTNLGLSGDSAPLYSTEDNDMVDIINDGVNPRSIKDISGNEMVGSWSGLFGVISLDHDFSGVVDGPFWTGSSSNGKATDTNRTCNSWTDNSPAGGLYRGMWGDNSVIDSDWIFNDSTCDQTRHVLCVAY